MVKRQIPFHLKSIFFFSFA